MTTALAGLRVVDLSWGLAGALTTLVLADYGADVLRIEPPEGDVLRGEPAWPCWGRGKRSVVQDLRVASARATVRRLVEGADVVVESFRPGRAERWRLAYEDFAEQHPGLVYASITGFGRRGPYAGLKGYEGVVMAKMGGMSHVTGMAPRPGPAFPAVPHASFSAAHTALHGILAALLVRERTGRGQHVEATLAQAMAAHDPWEWFLRVLCEKYPQAYTPARPYSERGVPTQGFAFRLLVCLTKDGRWLQFSQSAPHLFREFMEVLGLAWMFDDPRWRSAPDFETEAEREAFWEILLEAARRRTLAEWEAVFRDRPNVWAELFRTTREALDHPQLRHDGRVIAVDDPRVGPTEQLAPFVRMTTTPGAVRAPAPELGAHTAEVVDALTGGALVAPAQRRVGGLPERPLAGITVLELGLWYAAPYGPALLADLGARVIKIEPLAGEPMRHVMPVPDAGAVKSLQGKESVALDLERAEGRAIVQRLAARADAVLVGYRGGVAERLGVDWPTLARENPRLVYLAAPGYGTDGPCARKPAYAPTIGVATGIGLFQAGPSIPEGPGLDLAEIKPASIRLSWAAQAPANADGCSALGVATALLLGLLARERTGVGQAMQTSMLGTTMYAVSDDAIAYAGRPARRVPDPMLHGLGALYRLYETREGWLFLAAPKASEWMRLGPLVGLADDARFATTAGRAANDGALAGALARVFRERPAAEWEQMLTAADVAGVEVAEGPIARVVVDEPWYRDAGFMAEVEHPTFGTHRRLAPLVSLSLTPGRARPAPLLGQHTSAVLRELGYTTSEIEQLARERIVGRAEL
ncbi:MAG: CaiB/BaiF CoA transferase family protein [Candidatus Binatia bacterium]